VLDRSNCIRFLGLEMHNIGVYRVSLRSFGCYCFAFFAMLLFNYFVLLYSLTYSCIYKRLPKLWLLKTALAESVGAKRA
jgi:hypothetical protein